jgi:hypothetical protein
MRRAWTGGGRWRLPAVLVALLVACAGCAHVLGGQPAATPVPVLTAAQAARQALANLTEAGVVHYRGSLTNPDGKQITLDVSVTATGEAGGSITVGDEHGSLLVVNGTLYVNAPARFWSLLAGDPGSEADAVGSRWVKVPAVTIGVDIGASLLPIAFGADLTRQVDGQATDPFTGLPTTTVHGIRVAAVPIGGGTLDLAVGGTHGLVHVTLPADFGTAQNLSLDVADVTTSEAGVYQDLNQQAQQLKTAVDTNVDIEQGGQSWGTCTASACSVIVTFTNASPIATKVVVSGTWKGDDQPVGTCEVLVGPVAAGKSTTAACTDSSAQWTSFYNRAHATPGQHPYEVDWTAEAVAAPPNLGRLSAEAGAASTPAITDPRRTDGLAFVYEITYQDPSGTPRVWKYGVTQNTSWQRYTNDQLTACRAATRTSCAAALVTSSGNRPSADALATSLVAKAAGSGGCPPGQWVDCAGSPTG